MNETQIIICGHGSNTPSLKNMYSYLQSRYETFAKNGARKQLVSVRRFKKLDDEHRKKFHDTYATILGRNIYSQDLREFCYEKYRDGKYYSDCSSSGCHTFEKIGYKCPSFNTAGMYTSDEYFETVPVRITKGHVINPEVLKVGDCLLFAGNDPNRPLQIGHVEYIYEMPTQTTKEIKGVVKVTTDANIRLEPDGDIISYAKAGTMLEVSEKCGKWLKCDKGWISRNLCVGWIAEKHSGEIRRWYLNKGTYPSYCVTEIDGKNYCFDSDGWLVDSKHIDADEGFII